MQGDDDILTVALDKGAAGLRLDRALAEALPSLSRERLKSLIKGGRVVDANGAVLWDPSAKVAALATIAVHLPAATPAHNVAQNMDLVIAYEDEHLIVIDKPAGMVVHPAAGNLDGTMVNALLHHCAGQLSGIGGVARPGIVHRIDKDTRHIGHPLVGDPVYGRQRKPLSDILRSRNFVRQALHAAHLGFIHPVTGNEIALDSELPSDMRELLDELRV
ncbi:MAG: hypothetical protein EOP63_09505 [Sphingomonadales bacterium]|nr:MAG: hypothetical protein EOP63_09505 [Sphingomonadales bacterium]